MIKKTEAEIMKNWQGDPNNPLVSIQCTAYNHEHYISQCLDGFLIQETTFPFEVIVHDDASPDHTADIIREYEKKYPTIIRPIYETENQYPKRDGSIRKIMNRNSRGRYYAFCEGDDFWIDSSKLQKQFDYMEIHPDCSLCTHNTIKHDLRGIEEDQLFSHWDNIHILTAEEAIMDWDIHTSSFFYRIETENIPDDLPIVWCGDYRRVLYAFSLGEIVCLPFVMSVYNFGNANGVTMQTRDKSKIISAHEGRRSLLDAYNSFTNKKYDQFVSKRIAMITCCIMDEEFDKISRAEEKERKQLYHNVVQKLKKDALFTEIKNYIPWKVRLKRAVLCNSYTAFILREEKKRVKGKSFDKVGKEW